MTFGGQRFGRGYPTGETAGDKGVGVALELSRRFAVGLPYLQSVQPYAVVDHARTWVNDSRFRLSHAHLTSVAPGLRISDQKRYAFDINLAKPVADRPVNAGGRPLRFNANYSLQFE